MSSPVMAAYAALLEKCRCETLEVAANIPEAARYARFKEGTATPLWLIGHLCVPVNGVLLGLVLGKRGPLTREQMRPFMPDFLEGGPPTANPADYPDWETLLRRYDDLMRQAVAGVRELDEVVLADPTPERAHPLFRARYPTLLDCLHQVIGHDAYHRGQMALIAKHAG